MSYFFTDAFTDNLFEHSDLMDGAEIRLVLFSGAPQTDLSLGPWVGEANTKADLVNWYPGWQEVSGIAGYPITTTLAVSTRAFPIVGQEPRQNRYVMFTEYGFDDLSEAVGIQAIGVEYIGELSGYTDPLIFVTNTPVGAGTNISPDDALTANPDDSFPDATNRWLFAWADPATAATNVLPIEGPLAIFRAPPTFEVSNTLHVWLYPWRANMIANPSFEDAATDVGYWASSKLLTRVAGGAPGGGSWAMQVSGSKAIVESNEWPTLMGEDYAEQWTLQAMVKGDGNLKVGLVYWDRDYRGTGADWGTETWQLNPDTWIHVACVRHGPQAYRAMMRLETDGSGITIDKVLAERGAIKEFPYFDGDETYAAADSYGWYGGKSRAGKSYSMLYGNRRAVMGRLFATPTNTDDPDDVITDDEVKAAGMVYSWVPAGVNVIPHIDVFYPNDLRLPIPAKSASVYPYYSREEDPMGVVNPWPLTISIEVAGLLATLTMENAEALTAYGVIWQQPPGIGGNFVTDAGGYLQTDHTYPEAGSYTFELYYNPNGVPPDPPVLIYTEVVTVA